MNHLKHLEEKHQNIMRQLDEVMREINKELVKKVKLIPIYYPVIKRPLSGCGILYLIYLFRSKYQNWKTKRLWRKHPK